MSAHRHCLLYIMMFINPYTVFFLSSNYEQSASSFFPFVRLFQFLCWVFVSIHWHYIDLIDPHPHFYSGRTKIWKLTSKMRTSVVERTYPFVTEICMQIIRQIYYANSYKRENPFRTLGSRIAFETLHIRTKVRTNFVRKLA